MIPAYNAAAYIGECLDSVLAQTADDYEIVVLNDGSKDGTDAICREYARRDGRINYVRQDDNRGVAAARNRLLDIASGDWVVFVDSDDYVSDRYLAHFEERIAEHPETDVFTCGKYLVYGKDITATRISFKNGKDDYYRELLKKRYWKAPSGLCAKALRRSLIERHRVRCAGHFDMGEDLYFLVVLLYHTDKIDIGDQPLYYYRQIGSSLTHNPDLLRQDIACYQAIIDFLRTKPDAGKYAESVNFGKMQIRQRWYLSVRRQEQGDADPFIFNDVRYEGLPPLDKIRLFCINHDMFDSIRAINRIARLFR